MGLTVLEIKVGNATDHDVTENVKSLSDSGTISSAGPSSKMAISIDDDFKSLYGGKRLDDYYFPTHNPHGLPGEFPA
ncbi:MAG: hypothetical protein JSV84_12710 [Gemmatimonadota bacterium]|nr:MAG: hypothetical protein JSV84_12710 [Gemmatimonadota bacterium]